MPFIKKMVMKGFKSFAAETELPFEDGINVVVGPNGSGKSNITDAICFVLGRLSIKSIRAKKASHLIFSGTKARKPSHQAEVEMIFDNTDKTFPLQDEVKIKRIVKQSGQSVYKINGETRTRQDVLELLAKAGVDPYGFNIILQGEIASLVKMQPEERRKIIEEVSGISVYEIRKEKSVKELEKTDNKIKEISAVLKERTAYLRNLEKEKQQALRYKKLQQIVKRCKASIFKKRISDKEKEKSIQEENLSKQGKKADKLRIEIGNQREEIKKLNEKIEEINTKIQKSSGFEQESLSSELADIKAELAGLNVKQENYSNQLEEINKRNEELKKNIQETEQEIEELRKTKGKSRKNELDKKISQLEEIEERIRKQNSNKSSLELVTQRIIDKKSYLNTTESELSSLLERIEQIESGIKYKENLEQNKDKIEELEKQKKQTQENQETAEKEFKNQDKIIAVSKEQIQELENLKKQVNKIDICPLCKTKITENHKGHIEKESNEKISKISEKISSSETKIIKLNSQITENKNKIIKLENEIQERNQDIIKLEGIRDRKNNLRELRENKENLKKQIQELENKKKNLEKSLVYKNTEEDYESLKLEIEELKRHEESNLGTEVTIKQRELDRMKIIVKQILRDKENIKKELSSISSQIDEFSSNLEEKEEQEQELQEKFKKMLEQKTKYQDNIKSLESQLLEKQHSLRIVEDEINNLKINLAQIKAQIEGIEEEAREFQNTPTLKLPFSQLKEKLEKTQRILDNLGNVNLRALEVYEDVKKQYEAVYEKIQQLETEKESVLKIIEEIDKKKKRTFNKTLKEVNELFTRNFSQLSTKGKAFLELENKQEPFEAGLDIIIKVGKGKYFDVTSLSGGEKTLIALSLIFAIQEYKPYCFYIFDEIDAALDKRNSERLALLLKKHMNKGQYIVVTHNDSIIEESELLYGITMSEGISKIISLKV